MPLDKGKLQKLYSTLQQGGYSQSYDEFEKGFTGNDNYPNRKKVYDLLTEHGADIGNNYEDFMKKMYTPAASSPAPSYSQQRTQAPAPKPQPKPAPKPKPRPKPKPKGGGMTAAERAQFIRNAQGIVHHSAAGLQRVKNQMEYTKQKMKHRNVTKVHLGLGGGTKRTGGNSNVMVKHKDGTITEDNGYSPELNQALGNTYVTESGNEYDDPLGADFEQNVIDNQKTMIAQYNSERSVPGRLKSAYEMRDELEKKLEARRAELEQKRNERGTAANILQDLGNIVASDKMGGVNPYSDEMRGYENDPEYMSLMSSLRKVNSSIQTLETIKSGKNNSFWRGLSDTMSNGYTFNDGLPEMRDATAIINAQKHLPSINKKLKSGQPLTHDEQVAYDVLRANVFDNDVQGQYQDQLGAWYRAGSTTGTTIDFMKDFALTGGGAGSMTKGIYNGIVKKGTAALAKRGIEKGAKAAIAKGVLKATGIAAGTTAAGTMVSNTTGFGRVGAETGTNVAGQVGRDKNGNFTIEGQQSLLKGFANAERDMIGENQSEMFGEFIPGGGKYIKKGLEKIGLSKISGALTSIGNKEWYKQYSNLLKAGGWNGLPGEAMEEYEGMLFDALTGNGEQAWQQFKDPKTHIDIWLGCATTGALLGAVPTVVQAHHTAQYYRYKHATDSSDKVAAFRMTQAKWEPIKDIFDNTDNEHMADAVMDNVVNNKDLSQQEKVAALNYVRNLTKMRGYNIGTANNAGEEKDPEVEAQNEAYGNGYNTTDATAMNDAKNRLAAAQAKFDEAMKKEGVETWEGHPDMQDIQHRHHDADEVLNMKWGDDGSLVYEEGDPIRKLAQDVVNAQQEYEGMMQRVRDDIDDEVQQTSFMYDQRTNPQTGMIQSATLKAQNPDGTDRKVYITSGNVVMTDDGKSVDREKSDMSIVVVDDEGKVQMISPEDIFSLDTPIDGAQAKHQWLAAIQQSKAQEAADKINGKVNLAAGNTYTLTDSTGQQIEATIVADGQTGAVQNPDGTVNVSMNGKVVPMDVNTLQQMVDNTNMQRAAQGDEEDTTGDAAAMQQPTEPGNTEQTDDEGGTVTPEGAAVPTYPGSVVAPDVQAPHEWQVDDTFTIDNGGMPVRGQVTGVGEDGVEIYTESPVNGKKMQVVSPEELQSMTTEINGETVQGQEDAAAMQQPTQPVDGEQTGDNGSNGVNGEQPQGQAEPLSSQAEPQQTEGQQPQRAIDRIPSQQIDDGKGNVRTVHNWEQAEPGDTYDALTEIYHGNADRVKKGIDNRVGKIDKAIKGVQKQMDAIDNSDDFDEVAAQSEQYDQLQQQKDALEQQKKYWQGVQMVPRNRKMDADRRSAEEQAAAKAAQEKAEAEAAEKARQEREQVNGVPDVINDVPADARQRGFRNVNGMVVKRQDNTEGVTGRESNVKFSSTDTAKGHIKVIDADQLQPSHVSGQRNPSFFIDEAQPKDRTDAVSGMAAAKIAADLNPEEITGDGSAYQFSAPTVNSRGEVIQGNNRSDALKLMYSNPAFKPAQDAYKQYIADHAEEFGFTPEDVEKIQQMKHPVMVNELDVPDDEAIRLGQMRASDNESGGIERIDPVTTSQKLGGKVSNFANVLLSSPDEDASLSDVLMQNGAKAVKWLRTQGAISDTAAQSAFDKKGNLTPEARMDLQNILKQSLFQGGVSDLSTMFDKMPAKAQKAILSTFMRDFDSAESERILPEIQKAIEAWYDCAMSNEAFAKASNYKAAKTAMHDWTLQTNLLDDNMPSDKFSNFAMELACRLQGCSMREAQQSLNDFFDLVQGKSQGDLFGGTTMGEQADRQESIRRIFNIEYKPISNDNGKTRSNAVADNSSQSGEGRQGSPTDGNGRERAESGSGSADGAGGAESHDEEGIDKGAAALQQPTQPSEDSKHSIGATSSSEKKEAERQGVNTEPSEKQKEAGNYKKGHIKVDGYDITIENPKGSTRSGKDASGKAWSVPMHYDYGYIKGTEGVDGDHIDVYLSDDPTSGNVYVVDQIDQTTGKFDEHKVMYGFPSKEAAVEAYKGQYEKGWKVGTVTEVSREDFKKWVESSKRKTKPFSEYKSVKETATAEQPTQPSASTERTEQNPTEHGTTETDTSVADSKRKQFDLFVRWDLERFIGKSKAKRVTVDWEHSEPENDYLPMKIDGEPSFVGVTEQDGEGDEIDRPIAIYDIAEGGDFPDVPKTAEFEAYAKDYNAENNLTENSDDYATMDANNPYVAFRSVDAAVKFNDWLHEKGKGAAAEQRRTEPSGDSSHSIGATSSSEKKEAERQGVNTEPTEKQKEAGNYKKGHIKVDGYDISIENPKGSVREKKDANGKVLWRTPMHYDYGYILGTKGTDGDHIDVYLSDNPTSGNVYVIDQIDQKTGKFDEHKVMYGFPSKEAAVEAYKGQYEKGWKVGTVTEVSREDFKKWVESSKRKTKPFSEYKSVKEASTAAEEGNTRQREGNGAYTDEELSLINDPVAKWLGKSNRTKAQQKAFANRERKSMESTVKELADRLHLGNVNIVMDASTLEGRKARAKGFYDRNTNEITIVIPNHRDVEDVMQTLLHEGVAHYGLRKMFGSHFDTFLDNVYAAADNDVRRRITDLAIRKYRGDFRVATEEYLASLAEDTDFERMPETFWQKIKRMFLAMLHDIGFENFADTHAFTLSDNELRYILWRSYENLKEPGRYRSILGEAEDVAKQAELKVGNYGEAAAQQRQTERLTQEVAEGDGVAEALSARAEEIRNMPSVFITKHNTSREYVREQYNKLGTATNKRDGKKVTFYHGVFGKMWRGVDSLFAKIAPQLKELFENSIYGFSSEDLLAGKKRPDGTIHKVHRNIDNYDYYVGKALINGKDYYVRFTVQNSEMKGNSGVHDVMVTDVSIYENSTGDASTSRRITGERLVANGTIYDAKLLHLFGFDVNNSEKVTDASGNVSEPAVWGKRDLLSKAEQVTEGIEPDLLFRDTIEDNDNTARATYDMMANMKKNIIREAWQDSMINVRNLQEAVLKQRHETLMPYEDAYEEENRMHGKSKAEEEDFTRNYYDPLLDAINAVAKEANVSLGDVVQYMMAKHGLERNEVFANRDAQAAWEKYQNEHPKGKKTYDEFYNQYREKDYSGLTELTGTDNVQDAEAEAQKIVYAMESMSDTNDLWAKTNAATKWTLKKAKDSGIVSKANYEQVRDMFDYYIPLRGWKDETADDIYDYVGIRNNGGDVFSPTLKKTHGRSTEADNPIAYIGSMAVSAIAQGNKNKVKQTFLGFVWNHPTNLVTVSDMWYRNYGTEQDPDWREEFPNIPEDATADEVAATVEQFEKDMETLASQGMATKKKGRLKISIPIKRSQALEHHVKVALNGREYVMYINGNPRAAQALNGTRARLAAENSHESAAIANVNRWLGQAYTSLSPAFTVKNLLRDYTMATALTFIKEGPDYARRFQGNMTLLGGPTRMFWLMHKYKSGKLDMQSETERLFREFMVSGGETGYTSLKDIDRYKAEMQKKWNRMNRSDADPRELWHDFTEGVENVNRCIEDTVRFATYMTSRKGGKTVRESVTDAKNITLNFNRKGSGEMGNSTFRHLYIFTNPAIQGLNTVASAAKHHPVRFSLAAGFIAAMGMMQPLLIGVIGSLFGGDGDDDWNPEDEYWKLPAWQRRNNYVFWIPGTHKFGMIPLGQEFRMLHGFGETLYSYTHGHADDNPALELTSQAADLLPLDMTGNSGNPMVTLMPTLMQPIAQVAANTEFTGRPIYKDSEWNKYEPAWQKAYVGTPSFLVSLSKEINELTGGNDHRQGVLETFTAKDIHWLKWANNPAIVDHLMKGYLGGPYSFVTGLGGMAWKAVTNGEAPDAQEIPVVNSIVTAPRVQQQNGKAKMPDWYYDMADESRRYQDEWSGYRKDWMAKKPGAKEHVEEMMKSPEFKMQMQVSAYINAINQIRAAQPTVENPQTEDEARSKQELAESLQHCLEMLEKIRKTGKALPEDETE